MSSTRVALPVESGGMVTSKKDTSPGAVAPETLTEVPLLSGTTIGCSVREQSAPAKPGGQMHWPEAQVPPEVQPRGAQALVESYVALKPSCRLPGCTRRATRREEVANVTDMGTGSSPVKAASGASLEASKMSRPSSP